MKTQQGTYKELLPANAVDYVENLLAGHDDLDIVVSKARLTKWGDFHKEGDRFVISVNENLNPYQFLITLLHEFAHYLVYKQHGKNAKPHGQEWKRTFSEILYDLMNSGLLPEKLTEALKKYAKNPRAAVTTDLNLKAALASFSFTESISPSTIEHLHPGDKFLFHGRIFERLERRRKLYKCLDIKRNKIYLFQPDVIVKKL